MSTLEPLAGGWLEGLLGTLALWGGVLLSLAAALSFYHGWKRRRLSALLSETPRTEAAEVRSPGVVRIRGRIVPAADADPLTAPFGDSECVLAAWEIEEMYDAPKNRSWEPAAWGVRSVPFYVEDSTGRLRVEVNDRTVGNETAEVFTPERLAVSDGVAVDGLHCEFESFGVRAETDYGESPPGRIREFLAATEGVSAGPMATTAVVDASKRRYREGVLRPGDEVSVVGYASREIESGTSSEPHEFVLAESDRTTLYLSIAPFDEVPDGGGSLLFGVLSGLAGAGLLAVAFVL